MKKTLLLLLCLPLMASAQTETLTNDDVIKLSKLDLPPAAIISKIKNSKSHFDVSVDALVTLKQQGVNGEVVSEMIGTASREEKVVASQKDYRDPKTMRKHGIYYYNKGDTSNLFVPLDPTDISNSKSGGFGTHVAQHYTYGMAKNNHVSELSGAHSRRQIEHNRPRFYFYCDPATSISPNEFSLVQLKEKNDSRQMIVGASNRYGHESGISEKQKVDFAYDQIADGVYKVYFKEPLDAGEYCFIYTGAAPVQGFRNKVYDFGISEPGK